MTVYYILMSVLVIGASQGPLLVMTLPANAGNLRVAGSIPGLRRSPLKGDGNLRRYSCLENPVDRGAWQAGP